MAPELRFIIILRDPVARAFAHEKALILDARDFFADPAGVAKTAYRFLGLPAYEPVAMPVKNAVTPKASTGTML